MIGIILIILFIFFIFIGVPIAYSIGTVALIGIMSIPNISNVTVPMKMFYGLNSFVLLAVPLFILSANLMNSGNISKKLIVRTTISISKTIPPCGVIRCNSSN